MAHSRYAMFIAAFAAAAMFAFCQSAAKPKKPKVPMIAGGTLSAMDETNTALRTRLQVSPIPLNRDPTYAPAQLCSYFQLYGTPQGESKESRLTVGSKPARNLLLITIRDESDVGTILIGRAGRLVDFNLKDVSTGLRSNSETFRSIATGQKARLRPTHGPTLETINQVTAIFPEYLPNRRQVGNVAAVVTTTENRPWATYVYRGVASYEGRAVAVFDLVRTFDSAPQIGPVTIGFQVADLSTMMPVLFVLDAGWKLRLRRLGCP